MVGKVDYDEWNRAVIESMDVVRTFLMRHIDPSRPASILITSASANEGKTTVSCQLAASLARAGKRVALVDCDFRRPSAHLMLEGTEGPGICEYLRGEVSLSEIQQQTQADGLTFIANAEIKAVTAWNGIVGLANSQAVSSLTRLIFDSSTSKSSGTSDQQTT